MEKNYRKYENYFKDYYLKNKEEINKKRKIYYHNVLKKKKEMSLSKDNVKKDKLQKEIDNYKNNKEVVINDKIKEEDYKKKEYNFTIRRNIIMGIC